MRIFLTWLRKNYMVENLPPLALWSECQITYLGQHLCGKTQQQQPLRLLFGHIWYSPCCGFWKLVGVINVSLCCSCIRKQVNYWPVTPKLVFRLFQMWVRCWKTAGLCFGLFSSCTELNLKLLESSRSRFQHRGQFPCISRSPSFCPASASPSSASRRPVSVWREGWLTRLQQCSLIICLHHSDKPHPPTPILTPSKRHTSSLYLLSE